MPYKLHPNTKSALWVIFATLIAVMALVIVMNFVTPTPATTSDMPVEQVVFMRDDGNDMEIFTINSDGTNERQLTNNDYTDWGPLFSPNKDYIAFHSDREGYDAIYVMSMHCNNATYRISPEGQYARYPSFSPDGTQVAFEMYVEGNWDIYILSLVDGSMTRVTSNIAVDGGASFSPDGTKLAYHSTQHGYYDIYVLDLQTSRTDRLTYFTETMDVWPEWSPSGDTIIFHSERDGDSEIFMMDADGDNQTNLTNNDTLERTPRFSVDGSQIVFRAERDGISNIYIMDADGSNIRPLTDNVLSDWYPDF